MTTPNTKNEVPRGRFPREAAEYSGTARHKVPSCGKFPSSRGGGMLVRYGEMLERPGAVAFLSRMVPTQQMKAVMSALYCRPLSPPPYPGRSLQPRLHPSASPLSPSSRRHLFRASSSFATSKPVLFWPIRGIFRHTGSRPNAVIRHPRCNTPYNALCRTNSSLPRFSLSRFFSSL